MRDNGTPFIWLFDQRFDSLVPEFQRFLARRGFSDPTPILGYRLFPDTEDPSVEDGPCPLRQEPPEEINRRFIRAWDRGDLPIQRSGGVPLAAFTLSGLEPREGLALFGPDPWSSDALNNKVRQFQWLHDAGLPLPQFSCCGDPATLRRELPALLRAWGALFVQPEISAGGSGAGRVRTADDLDGYLTRLAASGLADAGSRFLVTRYVPDALTLSGHGLVSRNGAVFVLGVDELLLDEFQFDGFLFPIFPRDGDLEAILSLTERAGRILAAKGYWGYFAVDFLSRPGHTPLITEINVRFAGETALLVANLRCNLFGVLWGDEWPDPLSCPLLPEPESRIAVTKIRPAIGEVYRPEAEQGTVEAFLAGRADAFRVRYHERPVRVEKGHFLGLAGRRFRLQDDKSDINFFYLQSRKTIVA
ncbi:MAG: hypothetical protein P9F19_15300 [Candidatus Contendobacter sp.]|nr:hypothetical protein [Candidatus Contendobacter sp.]MDG4558740.1 hypothetical protein [Candidatus Contendobacter sp.]